MLFRLPETGAYADRLGHLVAALPDDGRARSVIGRDSREVGVLLHDPALAQRPDLLRAVLDAAAVAVELGRPGDVFEIDSVGYRGNHRGHATRSTMSDYLRCTIVADGPPDCFSFAAIHGSMLRFHGSKVIGGTGRYQGATGKVIKNEGAGGGSDIVARIRVR